MRFAKNILVTTDFSEASDGAVAMAGELARAANVKLTLLHVHGRPPAAPEADVPPDSVLVSKNLDQDAIEGLERLKSTTLADLDNVKVVTIEHASAPLAIIDYAEETHADLIVIGTHGRTGIARLLLGSVAEKVVRHAHCAVLVVPHEKRQSQKQ